MVCKPTMSTFNKSDLSSDVTLRVKLRVCNSLLFRSVHMEMLAGFISGDKDHNSQTWLQLTDLTRWFNIKFPILLHLVGH